MEAERRSGMLDAARGIGILLVVFAHALIPPIRGGNAPVQGVWNVIYAFHMALFFVIAGWSFELSRAAHPARTFRAYAISRARKLLLPYLVCSVLVYVLVDLMHLVPRVRDILDANGYPLQKLSDVLRGIFLMRDNVGTHLWFLPRMFFVSVLSALLSQHAKRWYGLLVAFALSCVPEYNYFCWFLRSLGAYMVYFNAGRLLCGRAGGALTRPAWKPPLWIAVFAVLWLVKAPALGIANRVWQPFAYIVSGMFSMLLAFCGSCAVLSLAALCKGAHRLAMLGRAAFPVYLMHQPFLTTGTAAAALLLLRLPAWVSVALAAVAGLILPLVFDRYVLKKIPALSLLLLGERL